MRNLLFFPLNLLFISTVISCIPLSAYARVCTTITSSTSLSPPDITIQRDLPIDSPIGPEIHTHKVTSYSCTGTGGTEGAGVKAHGIYVKTINARRIYATNIDGIGYAIVGTDNSFCKGTTRWVGTDMDWRYSPEHQPLCLRSGLFSTPFEGTLGIQFYKYKDATSSGTISAKLVGAFIYYNSVIRWAAPESQVSITVFKINTVACQLLDSVTTVDMGTIYTKKFSGSGSNPGAEYTKEVDIKLSCNAGAKLNFKLDGDIYDKNKGILNIKSGESSATGVGLQLLYNNSPVPLKENTFVAVTADGLTNLILQARYYQIAEKITEGKADVSASLTVSFF